MAYTLLLADENQTVQRVVDLTFADGDVTVVSARDGDAALASLDSQSPDIVLADVGLPGKSGYEVARYVKHHPRLSHVPVLLMTGAFEPVDASRAEASGYDGVLTKPLDPRGLVRRVRDLLEKPATAPSVGAPVSVGPPGLAHTPLEVEPLAAPPVESEPRLPPIAEEKTFAFDELLAPPQLAEPLDLRLREPFTGAAPPDPWMRGFEATEPPAPEPMKAEDPATDLAGWPRETPERAEDETPWWLRPASLLESPARSDPAPHVFELPGSESLAPEGPELSQEPLQTLPAEPSHIFEMPEPAAFAPSSSERSWIDAAPKVEELAEPETPHVFELPEPEALQPTSIERSWFDAEPNVERPTEPESAPHVFELPESIAFEPAPSERSHPAFELSEPESFAMQVVEPGAEEWPVAEPETPEPPAAAPPTAAANVDSYFEELDIAISSLAASPRRVVPAEELPGASATAEPPAPARLERAKGAAPRSLADAFASLLAAEQGRGSAFQVPGSSFEEAGSRFEPVLQHEPSVVDAPAAASVDFGWADTALVDQPPAAHQASLPAIEPVAPAIAPALPAITHDELVDRVAQLALERMTGDEVRAIVEQVVTTTTERLVREEIERIKSNIK